LGKTSVTALTYLLCRLAFFLKLDLPRRFTEN
jgi:hypothetical protein